jgi:hypothetical protein
MKIGLLTVTRADKIILLIISAFVVVGGCWGFRAYKKSNAEELRCNAALAAIGAQIPLGMERAEALQRIQSLLGDELKVSEHDQPDRRILVQAPTRWHYKNWNLLLLVSDERIAAKVYRCPDSWREKRPGSPNDEITAGFVLPKGVQPYR